MALQAYSRLEALSGALEALASTVSDTKKIAYFLRTSIGDPSVELNLSEVFGGVSAIGDACAEVERIVQRVAAELS